MIVLQEIGTTENIWKFHVLVAVCKCFLAEFSFEVYLDDTFMTDVNAFSLMNFISGICECFLSHQFSIIRYKYIVDQFLYPYSSLLSFYYTPLCIYMYVALHTVYLILTSGTLPVCILIFNSSSPIFTTHT